MNANELIEKYVSDHAECRWMDACDLDDLLHAFVKELDSLAVPSNLDEAAEKYAKENCENYVDEEDGVTYIEEALRNTFKAGAKWREQQIPKLPDNLDEAAEKYEHNLGYYECMNQWPSVAFKAGAKWMANEFENNRLKDCEALSEEDYKLESDFVDAHIKKNYRTPTFLDAIKYGAERMAEKYDDDSYEEEVQELYRDDKGVHCVVSVGTDYNPGDIVIVHSRKK